MNNLNKNINEKKQIVLLSNATSKPRAVMIEFFDTIITDITMACSWRPEDIANVAIF